MCLEEGKEAVEIVVTSEDIVRPGCVGEMAVVTEVPGEVRAEVVHSTVGLVETVETVAVIQTTARERSRWVVVLRAGVVVHSQMMVAVVGAPRMTAVVVEGLVLTEVAVEEVLSTEGAEGEVQ